MSNTLQIQGYAICNGTVTNYSTDQILVTKNYIDSLINSKSKNVGEIRMYAGTEIPTGWLFCGGQSLDASANPQYSALFNVIGTTYGGTGKTNFNIPNLSQKMPIGSTNENQRYVNYQGSTSVSSGNKTISSNQLPSHSHTFNHTHIFSWNFYNWDFDNSAHAQTDNGENSVEGVDPVNAGSNATVTDTTGNTTFNSGTAGNGADFLPPFTAVNFIIYYGG
jgi:microcystin-dependent protein